jgi:putative membrane protein
MNRPSASSKPRAFRLGDARIVQTESERAVESMPTDRVLVEEQPDPFAASPQDERWRDEEAVVLAERRGILRRSLRSSAGLLLTALGGLVSLAIGLWVSQLIDALFARWQALGWIGAVLAAVLVLAVLALLARETYGVLRQRRIAHLYLRFAEAREADSQPQARSAVAALASLYGHRPETAAARKRLADFAGQIIDGRDLIDIAERELLRNLDRMVGREIAEAAKRVSLVTAISPRAFIGVLFVLAAIIRLMRRIAEIYGGRPGLLGFLKLARSVGAHLAITGGMAAGDSLIQQLVGHGIAARISARLGEGVLNGLLTARVGLSAMAVCRPMPFAALPQPGVGDVAPFLFEKKSVTATSKDR